MANIQGLQGRYATLSFRQDELEPRYAHTIGPLKLIGMRGDYSVYIGPDSIRGYVLLLDESKSDPELIAVYAKADDFSDAAMWAFRYLQDGTTTDADLTLFNVSIN